MKIGIDARALASEKPSGIGIYLINVLRVFMKIHSKYNLRKEDIVLYSDEKLMYYSDITDYFCVRYIPGRVGVIWCTLGLKNYLINDDIDIFWGPNYIVPFNTSRIRKVVTFHDVALLINPSWGRLKNAIVHNTFVKIASKLSDTIIADSNATKNDIERILKVDSSKIKTIYAAYNKYCNEFDDNSVRRILFENNKIKEKYYFIYVGTIEPRKNIINIIRAFDIFCDKCTDDNIALVIAGGKGWRCENIYAEREKSNNKGRIYFTGYISEEEKAALYKGAIAGIMTSYYEGFGIPVLEAMSIGCPEIITKISSLPEVGGDAALYVENPDNYKDICEKMLEIYRMNESERDELINKGYTQCQKFSYDKCGEEILKVLVG